MPKHIKISHYVHNHNNKNIQNLPINVINQLKVKLNNISRQRIQKDQDYYQVKQYLHIKFTMTDKKLQKLLNKVLMTHWRIQRIYQNKNTEMQQIQWNYQETIQHYGSNKQKKRVFDIKLMNLILQQCNNVIMNNDQNLNYNSKNNNKPFKKKSNISNNEMLSFTSQNKKLQKIEWNKEIKKQVINNNKKVMIKQKQMIVTREEQFRKLRQKIQQQDQKIRIMNRQIQQIYKKWQQLNIYLPNLKIYIKVLQEKIAKLLQPNKIQTQIDSKIDVLSNKIKLIDTHFQHIIQPQSLSLTDCTKISKLATEVLVMTDQNQNQLAQIQQFINTDLQSIINININTQNILKQIQYLINTRQQQKSPNQLLLTINQMIMPLIQQQ